MLSTDNYDIALDTNGDIELDQAGGFRILSGSEGLSQMLRTEILCLRGEWFINLDHGVPWLDILGSKFSEERIQQELAAVIGTVPGVGKIRSISSRLDSSRAAAVDFDVLATWGDSVTGTTGITP